MPGSLILYAKSDEQRARNVRTVLAGLGQDVYVECEELELGLPRQAQQETALAEHDLHFLFWSQAAAQQADLQILRQYAQHLHKRIIPVLLDDEPAPGTLDLLQSVSGSHLTDHLLAVLMHTAMVGNRQFGGLQFAWYDLPMSLNAGDAPELIVLRLPPGGCLTPSLLAAVFDWAAVERNGGPLFVIAPYGAATGAEAGELRRIFEEHCPPDTALILSLVDMPFREIPDKLLVQPEGDDHGRTWPVVAVWAKDFPQVVQVDVATPDVTHRAGPRIPLFRTPGGFSFGVLSLGATGSDPETLPEMAAGVFSAGLKRLQGGPAALDTCFLLTPNAQWEPQAARRLIQGVQPGAVPARVVVSPSTGLFTVTGGPDTYLESTCAYRATYDPAVGHFVRGCYRAIGARDQLGECEPALPLRQRVKEHVPTQPPVLPFAHAVQLGLQTTWPAIRGALLALPEVRRQRILEILSWPDSPLRLPPARTRQLVRALAMLAMAGEVQLDVQDGRFTAEWLQNRLLAVLQGNGDQDPGQSVGDYISRLNEVDERIDFDLFNRRWVVLLDHLGECEVIRTYKPSHIERGFVETDELAEACGPNEGDVYYTGVKYVESLLRRCNCPEDLLMEVS